MNLLVEELDDCMSRIVYPHCLTLEIREFKCYEVKIEVSEKASMHAVTRIQTQDTSGLSHVWTARQPPALTILCMYYTGGTECLSHTPGSHQNSIRGWLENSLYQERTHAERFFSHFKINAQSILPHAGKSASLPSTFASYYLRASLISTPFVLCFSYRLAHCCPQINKIVLFIQQK